MRMFLYVTLFCAGCSGQYVTVPVAPNVPVGPVAPTIPTVAAPAFAEPRAHTYVCKGNRNYCLDMIENICTSGYQIISEQGSDKHSSVLVDCNGVKNEDD